MSHLTIPAVVEERFKQNTMNKTVSYLIYHNSKDYEITWGKSKTLVVLPSIKSFYFTYYTLEYLKGKGRTKYMHGSCIKNQWYEINRKIRVSSKNVTSIYQHMTKNTIFYFHILNHTGKYMYILSQSLKTV